MTGLLTGPGIMTTVLWSPPGFLIRCGLLGLAFSDHLFELLVDLPGAFAGVRELRGLGQGLAEVLAGVVDFATRALDVVQSFLPADLKAVEAVLQPGDKSSGIGGTQVVCR